MKKQVGFTLIELLVVILIIGVLAAIALPQYQKAVTKAHMAQLVSAMRSIVLAQQAYYLEHGQYASSANLLDFQLNSPTDFYCSFAYSQKNEDSRISCIRNLNPKVTLQQYYGRKSFVCCTYKDDDFKADKLCRELLHVSTPYNTTNSEVSPRCYSGATVYL